MEYIFTNLPQYVRITSRSEFSSSVVSSGAVLLFTEDGLTLTGKLPDGTFISIGGSGSGGTDPVGDATANDILAGKSATVSGGSVISGAIQTVSATSSGSQINVPSGYIATAQNFTVSAGGIDVSSTTANASDVLSGKVFYNSGGIQTSGTIPTVSATSSGSQITVPSGFIASSKTFNVSGVDVSDTTATPNKVLAGYSFYDSSGMRAMGTIPTAYGYNAPTSSGMPVINPDYYIIPAGYHPSSSTFSATLFTTLVNVTANDVSSGKTFLGSNGHRSTGNAIFIDFSSTTAEATDVLSGKIFFTSGGIMTSGTIPTVSASLSANVTTVPSGYISSAQTLTVPLASSATVSGGIVTIPQGYVSAAYPVSDTNLVASNIASGVSIFGVEGSLNAGSPVDLIQVTSYTAPVPEFTVPEVYSMSGMTSAANPLDPEEPGIDFSVLNGTYTVTSDTASATDQLNRIYKHDSANYYLRHYSDEYDHYWLLGSAANMDMWDAMLHLNTADPLSAGTQTWYNMNYEASQSVTAAITSSATIPAVPMTLFGQMITSVTESAYDSARGVRTFVPDGPNVSFSAADDTPVVSGLAMVSGGRMLMQLRDSCTQAYGDLVANQVLSGGTQYVSSGYVYYNNSLHAMELNILSGGLADGNTIVSGSAFVSSGGTASNTTMHSGGVLHVSNGGIASGTTIYSGWLKASAGGTANDATINATGILDIYNGGVVNSITVKDGGKLFVYSGGTANNVTSETGATVNVYEGGTITYVEP